jgi:preprotein translocase subunit SecA
VDEKQKSVLLSEQGYEDAEEILAVKDLYDPREQWASFVINAIKAKELFLRDVNYIIRGKEVLIVDEFTGRVMQVFRYSTRPYDNIHFNWKSQWEIVWYHL